jgi:pimeloyl-ACP methyl ester carboxylesterase
VNPRRIRVMGSSRGGEPALLLGADYPQLVYGVIANTPADVAFCNLPDCDAAGLELRGQAGPVRPQGARAQRGFPSP